MTTRSRPTSVALLLTVLTALVGLVGLAPLALSGPADAAGGTTHRARTVDYHRPRVGACHDLTTYDQAGAQSDTRRPVRCAADHTTLTLAAPRVDPSVDLGNQHQVLALAEHFCTPAVQRTLGTERQVALSSYSYLFFVPTPAQRAHGASWLRCDLVRYGATKPLPLPTRVTRLGDPARYRPADARCLTGQTLRSTWCAGAHQWRAVGTVRHAHGAYPSQKAWEELGLKRCPAVVGSSTFVTRYPSSYGWNRAGRRLLVCFVASHR